MPFPETNEPIKKLYSYVNWNKKKDKSQSNTEQCSY